MYDTFEFELVRFTFKSSGCIIWSALGLLITYFPFSLQIYVILVIIFLFGDNQEPMS